MVVDALIELGRYEDASDAVDRLVEQSADLTSLARLSYVRELHGDLPGALEAMQAAATSPGLAPENTAFALALVGQLEQQDGQPDAARDAYDAALRLIPQHAPSIAGLGRLAIAAGDLSAAQAQFERAIEILPLPEYVIALGETLEAAGNAMDARKQYDLARAQIALLQAEGVVVDLDLALFEADHGDAATALMLAEAAYRATPTVRAADALGWALHRAGRDDEAWERTQEALRLGSRDPRFAYHAGAIALARGDEVTARGHLVGRFRRTPASPRPTPSRLDDSSTRSSPERPRAADSSEPGSTREPPPDGNNGEVATAGSRQSPSRDPMGRIASPQSHRERFDVSRRSKVVALGGALLIAASSVSGVFASSHREAPLISGDPSADNTDLYAFVSPDDPTKLTIVANYIPLQQPGGGPNFHPFDHERPLSHPHRQHR